MKRVFESETAEWNAGFHFGGASEGFIVDKHTLAGGLRHGVECVVVDNGAMRFTILVTRGMGIRHAHLGAMTLGWDSPVDGPVNPAYVNLWHPDGLGWLDGFDELFVRCGLTSNGAPEWDDQGRLICPLHGRIANIPAHTVTVEVDPDKGTIAVTGSVDEVRMFGPKLRLTTRIETEIGRRGFTVFDEVQNISAERGELELLYHINFGPPLLEPGAKVVLPIVRLAPRDAVAAANVAEWDTYGPESPGSKEAVFFAQLAADADDRTTAVLRNAAGDQGVRLGFKTTELPCFTLWKNRQAARDGYVTGLEPGTNFPNPKSWEKGQGRVIVLEPDETRSFEIELEGLPDKASVARAEKVVATLERGGVPVILPEPHPGWSKV